MTNIVETNILSFSQALEFAKKGIPVSNREWGFVDRITSVNKIMEVEADQIWSPENRRIATLIHGKKAMISVQPYSTKMTRSGIENYIPTNADLHGDWMLSDRALRLTGLWYNTEDSDECTLKFERVSSKEHLTENLPFWMLYDQEMIGYHSNVIFISGSAKASKMNATIYNMMAQALDNRFVDKVFDDWVVDDEFLEEQNWLEYCDIQANYYNFIRITKKDFDIYNRVTVDLPVNIIIDTDSLNDLDLPKGDNALDHVLYEIQKLQNACEETNLINFYAFSLKEQIQHSRSNEEA